MTACCRTFCTSVFRHSGIACLLAGAFSASSLIFAYISQYVFGLQPCVMCLYQRAPHFAAVAVGILAFLLYKKARCLHKLLAWVTVAIFLTGTGIAVYHVGIEEGYIEQTASCGAAKVNEEASLEELSAILMATDHVACDKPQFVLFRLSMAGWNALFSFIIAVYLSSAVLRDRNRRPVIKPV